MAKAEKRVKITLECTECKHRNYITMKSKINDRERLEMKKFCNHDRRHTVHLRSKTKMGYLPGGHALLRQQAADRGGQPGRPVGRVLLGPAAGRVAHRVAVPSGSGDLAVGVEQDRLDRLRADVRPDQVSHPGACLRALR